jgi:pimeloyl-ACP methyl ester carboxylesterase
MRRAFAVVTCCFACARALPPKVVSEDRGEPSVTATTTPPAAPSTALSVPPAPILDTSIDIGTVRLHLRCEGTGDPLVVFEAGLGLDGSAWRIVQPQVARVTRACAYDRAGRGLSGPAPYPHGQRQMAQELYALLNQSGHHGPYILVGHSMGGAIVRWFLDANPNDVVGMVLVDAATEDWPSKVLARVPLEAQPEFWRNLRAWEGLDADTYVAGYESLRNVTTSLGNHPLVILTAEKPESELALRLDMQAALKRLSSNNLHVVVKNSGHNIQLEAPASVVKYVEAVIHAARAHSRLSPLANDEQGD